MDLKWLLVASGLALAAASFFMQEKQRHQPLPAQGVSIRKLPGGGYEPDNGTMLFPSITDAEWILEASSSPEPRGPWDPGPYQQEDLVLPTPAVFAATGPETTFKCQRISVSGGSGGSQSVSSRHECDARVRSSSYYWHVSVRFGEPVPKNYDMRPGVSEAYDLLARKVAGEE